MTMRMDYRKSAPDLLNAVGALNRAVDGSGLDKSLLHLVKLRASQINGCAFCLDMHVKEARRDGEVEQRLHLVAAWRESPLFTPRERAALQWTEALTLLAQSRAEDGDYEPLKAHFSDAEIVKLSVAIGMINLWNRLAVGFRAEHPVDSRAEAA